MPLPLAFAEGQSTSGPVISTSTRYCVPTTPPVSSSTPTTLYVRGRLVGDGFSSTACWNAAWNPALDVIVRRISAPSPMPVLTADPSEHYRRAGRVHHPQTGGFRPMGGRE